MRTRKKEKIERLYRKNGIVGVSSYISDAEVSKYLLDSELYLNKETLFVLYKYVPDIYREVILQRLNKIEQDYTATFELILKTMNVEDSPQRIASLRKELFKTRNFREIRNYLINNPSFGDDFSYALTEDISYALEAINYLNKNYLEFFVKDIDVNYIEKIILKTKKVDVLERYIMYYKIHNNKELEKVLFELNDMNLLYIYVLKGNYSNEFNKDKIIELIENSRNLELVVKTAIYLKPKNLRNLNVEDFFLSIGLLELPEFKKKELITAAYEKTLSMEVKEYKECKDAIVLDKQKQLKNKFIGNNLHN